MPPKKPAKRSRSPSAASAAAPAATAAVAQWEALLPDPEPKAPWADAAAFRAAPLDDALAKVLAAKPKAQATLPDLHKTVQQTQWTEESVAAATPAALRDSMATVVKWKLTRGHFRPGLYEKFRSNDAGECKAALREAVTMLQVDDAWRYYFIPGSGADGGRRGGDVGAVCWAATPPPPPTRSVRLLAPTALHGAVRRLAALHGIGPATATALLACVIPNPPPSPSSPSRSPSSQKGTKAKAATGVPIGCCAFMSDEAMAAVGLPLQYTDAVAARFLARTTALLARLRLEDPPLPPPPSLREVGEALWAFRTLGR